MMMTIMMMVLLTMMMTLSIYNGRGDECELVNLFAPPSFKRNLFCSYTGKLMIMLRIVMVVMMMMMMMMMIMVVMMMMTIMMMVLLTMMMTLSIYNGRGDECELVNLFAPPSF